MKLEKPYEQSFKEVVKKKSWIKSSRRQDQELSSCSPSQMENFPVLGNNEGSSKENTLKAYSKTYMPKMNDVCQNTFTSIILIFVLTAIISCIIFTLYIRKWNS
jgi:hypothetical protein